MPQNPASTGGNNEKWYSGRSGGAVLVIEGLTERPLAHHVRHSPDGFAWGYGGSGPADLARCILIDALGDEARCDHCAGTGVVVIVDGEEMSITKAREDYDYDDPTNVLGLGRPYGCLRCEDGITVEPMMYQQFKFDVVAQFTTDQPWSMPREQVLAWHRAWLVREG